MIVTYNSDSELAAGLGCSTLKSNLYLKSVDSSAGGDGESMLYSKSDTLAGAHPHDPV